MVMTVLPSSQIETIRRNNSDQQVLLFVDLQANCLCITTAAYDYLKKTYWKPKDSVAHPAQDSPVHVNLNRV